MRVFGIVAVGLVLAGCQTMQRANEYGRGFADAKFQANGRTFTAWVHPRQDALLLQITIGNAAGRGFVQGLTFGMAEMQIPYDDWKAAADWVVTPAGCTATRVYPLDQTSTWEAAYSCPAGVDLRQMIEANRATLREGQPLRR